MSRDMKPPRKAAPAKKKSGGGTLLGMFIGLVLGVGIAAGVVLYMNKSPLPFNQKPAAKEAPAPGAVPKSQPVVPQEPVALPGKPGDPVPEKRFQFYDILPGKSEPKPDKAGTGRDEPKKEEAKKDESKESKTPLFLQAGSFSTAQDADNQKAKLAFMGHEAVVQQVMVQDKTYYRVRVGPYTRIDDLNKTRADLAKAGIEAQLVKNKE
jgi:cell division protein FtsN